MTWFERLSSLDATFLYLEDRTAHMHVGAVAVFHGKPPRYEDLVDLIASRLPRVPRYRQRLAFVPYQAGRPVWIDESDLDLQYHVRHTALPAPGGDAALKTLAGRLFAQRLDRDKPLWEMWLIEGLGDDRFAILSKTHHCMIDGVSGVDLASVLMDTDRGSTEPPKPAPWTPRPAPSRTELVAASLRDQVLSPFGLVRGAFDPAAEGRKTLLEFVAGAKPLVGLSTMSRAPESSLNVPIGPHRRWEMVKLDLGAVKNVRASLGGTVNDVILAVVSGAIRRLFFARSETPKDLRAMVPVSIRAPEKRGTFGNLVTAIFAPLPVGEADPKARLRAVSSSMKGLKESRQAVGALALTRLGEFAPPTILAQAARLEMMAKYVNVVVTNVPGPQVPLYLLGRRLDGCYPAVPLAQSQTLGIALLSYDGSIGVGLLADADRMRDLDVMAEAIREELGELVALAARTS
ncbi:MAG: wax ester/triacylglycerol synthase family O-acyltransferase [Polyangiaceae bacterium]